MGRIMPLARSRRSCPLRSREGVEPGSNLLQVDPRNPANCSQRSVWVRIGGLRARQDAGYGDRGLLTEQAHIPLQPCILSAIDSDAEVRIPPAQPASPVSDGLRACGHTMPFRKLETRLTGRVCIACVS